MMDVKPLKGTRCRAERAIIGHQGIVRANTEGTIQHVIDNLDRRLINVEWDNGVTMYAFPDEVEIQQKEEAVVPVCWEDDGGPTQTELLGIKIAVGHHERLRSLDMVQSWGAKVGGTACDRGSDGMCQRSTGAR